MNKQELVKAISGKVNASNKTIAEVLDAILEEIKQSVCSGGKVGLVGFGTFQPRERAARTGRNPRTGEAFQIDAKVVPTFCAGKNFKTRVSGILAGKK